MPYSIQATAGSGPWSGTCGFKEDNDLFRTNSTQELDNIDFDDDPFGWGNGMDADRVASLLEDLDNGLEIPQGDKETLQKIGFLDKETNITSPTDQKKSVFSLISAFAVKAFQSISDFFTGLSTSITELTTPVQVEMREVAHPRTLPPETFEFI